MSDILATQFDADYQGVVAANGELTITIESKQNVNWILTQVTYEMLTAPGGGSVRFFKENSAAIPGFSPRRGALGGDPPVVLRPGERAYLEWSDCTPGESGKVWVIYNRIDPWARQ